MLQLPDVGALQAKYSIATVGFLVLVAGMLLAIIQAFNAVFGRASGAS